MSVCLGGSGLGTETPRPDLRIRQIDGRAEVYLPTEPLAPVVGTRYRLQVEGSSDLRVWDAPVGLTPSDDPGAPLKLTLGDKSATFFRLKADLQDTGGPTDGAELSGYNRVFAQELRRIGYPSTAEFAAQNSPTNVYLPRIGFDPTTARYWKEFDTDPAVFNATLPAKSLDRRLHDFRLDAEESARFRTNGFVVSERLGSYSFADVYYKVFADDFPVFISADSALHAWHWSYQAMLGELEETQLTQAFQTVLDLMAGQVAGLAGEAGDGPLRPSVRDADYFLAVARSILTGTVVPSMLGQDARVAETLAAVAAQKYRQDFLLWGEKHPDDERLFDFSQFTVRGHYTRNAALGRYFQAFIWTALADLRVAGPGASAREAGTAVALHELYSRGGAAASWEALDELLGVFVGRPSALTFRELGPLRTAGGLTFEAANTPGAVAKFQAALLAGDYGVQSYASAAYVSPFGPGQTQLPRAFSVIGQRSIPDGWATAQVTFDRVLWNEVLPGGKSYFGKVVRRLPTALDVAFGVFGNQQVVPEIVAGITQSGLPYQHNLAAVKATFDQQSLPAWHDTIYSRWLYALRMLSAPTTDARFPQAMRTRAWAHKTVNTQLASWTQLRHDTVLYAAQPYSGIITCEYPAGYVEPRVEFWQAMWSSAQWTARALDRFEATGRLTIRSNPFEPPRSFDLEYLRKRRIDHCLNFAAQMVTLQEMARKETKGEPFSPSETAFVRGTMNEQTHPYFGKSFDGWFPRLFYVDYGGAVIAPCDRPDALVTDVHSAPPDDRFAGGVLHEAVGAVDLLMVAVDSGPDKMVYAGPTLSHYQFVEGPGLVRLNDAEWQARLGSKARPARPVWTQDYLVPK